MTKRQKKNRVRELVSELVAQMKERFSAVELLSTEEWPTGMVVVNVHAPYEDPLDVIQPVLERLVEILVNEGICISILPTRERSAQKAA